MVPVVSSEFYINAIVNVVEFDVWGSFKCFLNLWSQHLWLNVAAEENNGC